MAGGQEIHPFGFVVPVHCVLAVRACALVQAEGRMSGHFVCTEIATLIINLGNWGYGQCGVAVPRCVRFGSAG